MNSAPPWILLLKVCLSLVFALSYLTLLMAAENKQHPMRKLASDNSVGYISIDCGVDKDYIDSNTNISYQSDTSFVSTGENHMTSSDHSFDESYFKKQLNSLRSFPNGKKNCYTLKPKESKNNKYHITALFAYGNYDYKDKIPKFDVYLGVNYWVTIDMDDVEDTFPLDTFYVASYDSMDVCLVNTGRGTPIISILELRLFRDSIYETELNSQSLDLMRRSNLGSFEYGGDYVRYMDDIYSRIWFVPDNFTGQVPFNTSAAISIDGTNDDYRLPRAVLTTAVHEVHLSSSLHIYELDYDNAYEYIVYLHFFEFEEQAQNQKKRIMDIAFNGKSILPEPLTLNYGKPKTINQRVKLDHDYGDIHISITSTPESDLPAMLNAYEIYRIKNQTSLPTNIEDVNAIREIKQTYGISKMDWQGDPCVPSTLSWTGLSCSSDSNPRIISMNLSSSKLTGEIATSFLNLTELESLDLSNNELTGPLPEFLAQLPYLKILNLSGNKLTGSIPKALKAKIDNKTLQLSLDGNSGFCLKGSCKSKKFVVPLVSSIAALVIITLCSLIIWRLQRKRQEVVVKEFKEEVFVNLKSRAYSYAEVIEITDNFKTTIGEGGFGKVYFGTLQDDTQVAVKLLSLSSKQGYKAFKSEAELLMFLHHRNLVSLMGYCDEGDVKALIYEYMDNGNLHQNLSENASNVLNWKERLQIAVDTAHGLDYLHNGCKPPIIHRDLKTSNILLSAKMEAKIADFGLSRTFANDTDSHILTLPAGTPGYLDPQFRISKKSDIYSFGIILFELITGQPAVKQTAEGATHMLHWVIPAIEVGDIINIIDQRLQGNYNVASVQKAIVVALACVPTAAAQRPDISLVLAELKECLSMEMVHRTNSLIFDSQITEIYAR